MLYLHSRSTWESSHHTTFFLYSCQLMGQLKYCYSTSDFFMVEELSRQNFKSNPQFDDKFVQQLLLPLTSFAAIGIIIVSSKTIACNWRLCLAATINWFLFFIVRSIYPFSLCLPQFGYSFLIIFLILSLAFPLPSHPLLM